MKVGFFASSDLEQIEKAIALVLEQSPDAEGRVAYVRESFKTSLGKKLDGFVVRSDGMRGRHFGFLRDLRRERFHALFVIFGGGRDHWKLKLISHFVRPCHLYVINENGNFFEWNRRSLPLIKQHLKWRWSHAAGPSFPSQSRGRFSLGVLARLYSLTLGPVLGLVFLIAATIAWEARRIGRGILGRNG